MAPRVPAAPVSAARQARLLAGLAITGAVPLTVGAIAWITGTAMKAVYHGRWGSTAGLGEVLVVVGLICGLIMFVIAATGDRAGPRPTATTGRTAALPLASPEQQAALADPRPPDPGPPTGPIAATGPLPLTGQVPPGAVPPQVIEPYLAPAPFPPERPW